MPIVAALPAIAAVASTAAAGKQLFSGPGGAAPGMAPITSGINQDQTDQAVGRSYNALDTQNNFVNALQAQGGLGNQTQVYNQLQQVAAGQGPNPAEAMLANSTGANVDNQAALMASQRGVASNPALIARQAAQQGAAIQQNAAGQAAALQAQQSLGAIGQAGQLATQQAAQQLQGTNQYAQNAETYHDDLLKAQAAYNQALTGGQGSVNSANAALANQRSDQLSNVTGNLANAAGVIGNLGGTKAPNTVPAPTGAAGGAFGVGSTPINVAEGGIIPQSPVMIHLLGSGQKMALGGNVGSKLKSGGKVPGTPVVGGAKNSYANDTVKALLSPGEIVIPRSITQGKNPAKDAAAFVAAAIAKNGKALSRTK